ncbi:hypothetical protein ACF0H5_014255 [Mactra antiquata]
MDVLSEAMDDGVLQTLTGPLKALIAELLKGYTPVAENEADTVAGEIRFIARCKSLGNRCLGRNLVVRHGSTQHRAVVIGAMHGMERIANQYYSL